MAGESYKRAILAHKLTLQALWRLLHPQLMELISDCDSTLKANLEKYSLNKETEDFEHLISALETDQFLGIKEQFQKNEAEFKFRLLVDLVDMELVLLLLTFSRAQRDGIWD